MQYILVGFTNDTGFRVFAFEGISEDRIRTQYRVRADLVLMKKHGIRVQELPLLCRELLERRDQADTTRAFTYTDADMTLYAEACAAKAAEAKRRKGLRKTIPENTEAFPA